MVLFDQRVSHTVLQVCGVRPLYCYSSTGATPVVTDVDAIEGGSWGSLRPERGFWRVACFSQKYD